MGVGNESAKTSFSCHLVGLAPGRLGSGLGSGELVKKGLKKGHIPDIGVCFFVNHSRKKQTHENGPHNFSPLIWAGGGVGVE